jgi:2',3'-cyclic-nucleotide 2'-phosphodiesterase (5'-nucleotidase family)
VCTNDVYTLEHLPRLRSLVQHAAAVDPADVLLATLAGDFVGPSMLSSLDSGRGMVDCMNMVPITHVVLGNHEADIGATELRERMAEFRGTWLSTNVVGFDPPLPSAQILEVGASASRRVRVGLVGVVMDDPSVYRAAPFGGATLLPANETARRAAAHLIAEEGCTSVIAITHQTLDADRALARGSGFPIIVGGHEHTVVLERIDATWLIKAGCDAAHAVVVDLEWPAEAPACAGPGDRDLPEVRARVEDVTRWPEDAALRARVDGHMRAVKALVGATLLHLAPDETLSSVGTRARQTSLGMLFCTLLRDTLEAEACVMNGGGIRGARTYARRLTYGDLEAEVPFDNEVVVASLPGRVLREAITASRAHAPVESGGFLQVDEGMEIARPGDRLVSIGGQPLDEAREYQVALVRNLFEGMDHIDPLVRFARESPARIPPPGSGRNVKMVLVDAFSHALWEQFGEFDVIDENHDGTIDAQEIADAIARATAEPASPITVELLMRAIDADHDHLISRADAEAAAHHGPHAG